MTVYLRHAAIFSCIFLMIKVRPNSGHSDGQGITESCSNLAPNHGTAKQSRPTPFKITFSPSAYSPGFPVSVKITTCSGTGFKGFMILARRADTRLNQNEDLGSFSKSTNTQQTCTGNTALSHTDSIEKRTLSFNWYPPTTPQGHIAFRAAFVRDYQTFWANVVSEVLADASISTEPTSNTLVAATRVDSSCPAGSSSSTTKSSVTGASEASTQSTTSPTDIASHTSKPSVIVKDPACGTTKGCYSNCRDSLCSFVVSWKEAGDHGIYTLTAKVPSSARAYMALGFSKDDKMGDDSVMGCVSRDDGFVILFNGHNTGQSAPTLFKDNNVTLENHTNADGILSCTFRRLIAAFPGGKQVNLSEPWMLLFAIGAASVSTENEDEISLSYHGPDSRFVSLAPYRISDTIDSVARDLHFSLVKAHGSLMVGAWIFFSSVGIVAARYYKDVWKNMLCSQKVWFQIHRTCMVLVLSATVTGFVIIFIEVKQWSELIETKEYLKGHPIMGVIVTALTLLNPLMALFRPHPDTPRRPIFNWAHWSVGMAAHILGVITIFFGVQLSKAGVPYYLVYILAAYVTWQIFVMLVLELIACYGRKNDRKDMYELRTGDGESSEINIPVTESSWSTLFKRIIFVTHITIVGALAVTVIVIIAVE